jgi:hypothetical protein
MRDLDVFEADVRTCTFLVRDMAGNYRYAHRSFREYFAARAAVRYFAQKSWPSHLWQGKTWHPAAWITPETAGFARDIIARRKVTKKIVECIESLQDGLLMLNILTVYGYVNDEISSALFGMIERYRERRALGGIEYRREILALADSFWSSSDDVRRGESAFKRER